MNRAGKYSGKQIGRAVIKLILSPLGIVSMFIIHDVWDRISEYPEGGYL